MPSSDGYRNLEKGRGKNSKSLKPGHTVGIATRFGPGNSAGRQFQKGKSGNEKGYQGPQLKTMKIRELGALPRSEWPEIGEGSASQDLAVRVFSRALDGVKPPIGENLIPDQASEKVVIDRIDPAKQEIVYSNADVFAKVAGFVNAALEAGIITEKAAKWFDGQIEAEIGGESGT